MHKTCLSHRLKCIDGGFLTKRRTYWRAGGAWVPGESSMSFDAVGTTFPCFTFVTTGALGTLYKNTCPIKAVSTHTHWENTIEFMPITSSYIPAFS